MRNLLIIIVLILTGISLSGDLRLEDSNYRTLAYIRDNGRIENASFETLGYFRDGCTRVEDASFHTIGYFDGETIENQNYDELYSLADDGRLTDERFRTVARITSDGTVEDDLFNVILYTEGTDSHMRKKIAAYLIFFSDHLPASD